MKKTFLILGLALMAAAPNAHAYIVDGNISDWGVSLIDPLSKNIHYLDTHTPTSSTANFVTEDNTDYKSGTVNVGPGWSFGNSYDAEAMYFDNDTTNAYIAVVTGVSKTEATYPAGSIFIDKGKYQDPSSPFYDPKKYEFGIDIATSKLYSLTSWKDSLYFPDSNPWEIGTSRTFIGDISFAYSGDQNTHYVLESGVPLSALGLQDGDKVYTHWTMYCGNDPLNLTGDVNVVPEPASLALLASGLVMGVGRLRSRKAIKSIV